MGGCASQKNFFGGVNKLKKKEKKIQKPPLKIWSRHPPPPRKFGAGTPPSKNLEQAPPRKFGAGTPHPPHPRKFGAGTPHPENLEQAHPPPRKFGAGTPPQKFGAGTRPRKFGAGTPPTKIWSRHPPPCGQTDACKLITLAQLRCGR